MQITTIGLDIAKNVFQVHGIDAAEKVVVRKQLRRGQMMKFFAALPPCLIRMRPVPARTTGHAFRSGRDFAAWIGLVPRQDSTGGKQKLGPISKQGDRY